MTTRWRRAGLVAVPLLLSTTLYAQTLPLPTLPPQEPGATDAGVPGAGPPPDATAGGLPSPPRPRPWEYALGLGTGWDSNIDLRLPDGPSGLGLVPRGRLARVFWSPKAQLRLGGNGEWIGYPEHRDLSRYKADFTLDGSYRSSLKTNWRAGASYTFGYSDSSRVLSEQGVLLPLVKTRTLAGILGVTQNLGARSSVRLDGRVYSTTFDQSETDAATLVDGLSFRGIAALQRVLGARDTTALEYSLENVVGRRLGIANGGSDDRYLTHYASLQWTHLLSPRHGFLLEAGASYTPEAGQAGLQRREGFFGGATYSRQVKQSRLSFFARREVAPAFGLGVSRVESRFGLRAVIPMGRSWTLRLNGTHVQPETPETAPVTYGTPDDASFILERRLGRHFQMSTEARYLRRGPTNVSPAVEAFRVGLFLALAGPP